MHKTLLLFLIFCCSSVYAKEVKLETTITAEIAQAGCSIIYVRAVQFGNINQKAFQAGAAELTKDLEFDLSCSASTKLIRVTFIPIHGVSPSSFTLAATSNPSVMYFLTRGTPQRLYEFNNAIDWNGGEIWKLTLAMNGSAPTIGDFSTSMTLQVTYI